MNIINCNLIHNETVCFNIKEQLISIIKIFFVYHYYITYTYKMEQDEKHLALCFNLFNTDIL